MRGLLWLGLLMGAPGLACEEVPVRPAAEAGPPPSTTPMSKAKQVLEGMSQPGTAGHNVYASLQPRPLTPAQEKVNLAKLDFGPPGEFFPSELEVLSFGMSPRALLRARPGARLEAPFVRKKRGRELVRRTATEEAPAGSPYGRFRYHFTNRKLVAVFAWLRLERMSKTVLKKAIEKWGHPRSDPKAKRLEKYHALRGVKRKEWRLRRGRVRLERPRFERRVRLYLASK